MASTFSYAMAAKGITTPVAKSAPASGSAAPAKDVPNGPAPASLVSASNWAEDDEAERSPEEVASARESRQQRSSSKPASRVSHSVDTSNTSSPDIGASSASTVTKDDDASSIPNTSSESTWDNKSQASTSVDKSVEPVEKTSEKVNKGKNAAAKALQEAPLPTVNIWKIRADEQKAKSQKVATAPSANGVSQGQNGSSSKKTDLGAQEKTVAAESRRKSRDEVSKHRNEAKGDMDSKKGAKSRSSEKDGKSASSALPPPPNRDEEAWPTPETVIDGDRKKALERGEKVEKERKESSSTTTHGKQEWVKVAYTPSVVFNTPLPNAVNSRRGGRPGGRGGAQNGGRTANSSNSGTGQSEKNGPASDGAINGEQVKRESSDEATLPEKSAKSKQSSAEGSTTAKDQTPQMTGTGPAKTNASSAHDAEMQHRRASTSQVPSQSNGYLPKNQHMGRLAKGRRNEYSGAAERRRDGASSPPKDNTSDDRRASSATQADSQADSQADGERRAPAYPDGPNGHHPKHNRFGSHTGGRNGGRGGARGSRASYSNNHQFTNGHVPPMQASSTLPLGPRSPSQFSPDSHGFFPPPSGKFGRNGHRSQSIAADSFRFQPYQNGAPVPPLQTYNMYDYSMMQPMSAVPFSPYVDHYALFSMITTQVEYYFSVDNLLKDMYLRRHMDSQGFVSLDFIAGFNRIKHLSTDLELIKLVCQQSNVIEYRTSEDGQDRLRRKDGWDRWVLSMADRDESAQNDGPKELHRPPVPHPTGFDQSMPPQWPVMSPGMPTGTYGNDGAYTIANGFHPAAQDSGPAGSEHPSNGVADERSNSAPVVNGHSAKASTT